jgi:putative transposase
MDFFTVITVNFRILYCLFLIRHSHREIIHFNVTESPTSEWVVQQLREAFSDSSEDRYLIFDRDAKVQYRRAKVSRLGGHFCHTHQPP